MIDKDINVSDKNVGKWISVKDMLPEYNGQYIVYMPASGAVISAYYYKNNGGFFIGRSIVTNKVSHWSYLPEPPKEEQRAIDNIDSVEVVPLEPLCQWLAGYAAPPKYAMDHVYDMNILNGPSERYEAWEYHFRELMKSGLMDAEEQNA